MTTRKHPTPSRPASATAMQQLVIEVRGKMTNGEGVRQARVVTAGPAAERGGRGGRGGGRQRPAEGAAPAAAPPSAPAPTQVGPASNPINVGVGNLFYGSEGWAAMSDQGFQAYKGDSSELIMEERPERGAGDSTGLHMQNFLACVKSRREQDLHDPIANAVPSANLCHLANISYRVGRALKHRARSDAEIHWRRRGDQNGHTPGLSQALRGVVSSCFACWLPCGISPCLCFQY